MTLNQLVEQKIRETLREFQDLTPGLEIPFLIYPFASNLTKGFYKPSKGTIAINENFLKQNTRNTLDQTVPHEVCHAVADTHYRKFKGLKIKPHGQEWKGLMVRLGLPPLECSAGNLISGEYYIECCGATHSFRGRSYSYVSCPACCKPFSREEWKKSTELVKQQELILREITQEEKMVIPAELLEAANKRQEHDFDLDW